jgi:uncharacterized membrane protein
MRSHRVRGGVAVFVVAVVTAGAIGAPVLRAAGDRSESLIYAVYNGQDTAGQVFKTMKSAQASTGERIESYAIVSEDLTGKVRIRDQRKRDAGVGAVVGGVIGLVGGPVGVALGASAGGVVGYLTGDAVGIPRDKVESMKQSLTPDSSAIVVVLNDRWVQNVEKDLQQAQARQVIGSQIGTR